MFPDSVVVKNFTFSKRECSCYINYGIRPYYRLVLTNEIPMVLGKEGLGQFADLREGHGEKEGVVFFCCFF